ncbi:hypothetical protein ACE1SV_58660 [Streptomyces sennicomposti]
MGTGSPCARLPVVQVEVFLRTHHRLVARANGRDPAIEALEDGERTAAPAVHLLRAATRATHNLVNRPRGPMDPAPSVPDWGRGVSSPTGETVRALLC